jgi:aryl-phospho-beta-D-glucosidase BglC (GH1 family)
MKKFMSDVLCVFLIILSVIMIVFLLKNKNNPKYINKDYDSYYKNSSLAMKDDLDKEKESISKNDETNKNLENVSKNDNNSNLNEEIQNKKVNTINNEEKSDIKNNNVNNETNNKNINISNSKDKEEKNNITNDKKEDENSNSDVKNDNESKEDNKNDQSTNISNDKDKEEDKKDNSDINDNNQNDKEDNNSSNIPSNDEDKKDNESNDDSNQKNDENNNLNDNKSKNNLVSYNGWLKIENNTLVNERKEKIRLKGISTHGIQWYSKYANYDMMKSLKEELGINLFRIAMYTEENGYIYNKSLKNKVEEIVENAKKLDMYVIIDWHILSDGDPLMHKEEAKEFFREMSLKYKDYPNVIYEICNEPNGNVTWENNIKPYAEEVIKEIRENSKKSIIIVGTPTWDQEVDKPAKNKINDELVMYALHFYSGTHTEWLRERVKEALKNIPIFVSEWGVSDASGNGGVYKEETIKWINFMKENNLSYAVWSLSDKNESSALLIPGASENKIIDDNLSEAGKLIKSVIKD